MNGTRQLLAHAVDVNLLGANRETNERIQELYDAS
jgi:hypothetical protein